MTPWLDDGDVRIHLGDVLDVLPTLPDASVDCCVTSPPYWGLRDYGTGEWQGGNDPACEHRVRENPRNEKTGLLGGTSTNGHAAEGFKESCPRCGARRVDRQLGLEPTPDEYVTNMVRVFREVRRVLADHGTLWLNLGDSYVAGQGGRQSAIGEMAACRKDRGATPKVRDDLPNPPAGWAERSMTHRVYLPDMKPKDLMGAPWRVALALQADGWYLRSDIIWAKPNPMPESVTDRPTKAHEYVFLLSKRPRYWFDAEAVREPAEYGRRQWSDAEAVLAAATNGHDTRTNHGVRARASVTGGDPSAGRNVRSVWEIATQPYAGAHFATYPEELVRRCLLAGCPVRVCRVCGRPSERIVERTPADMAARYERGEPVRHGTNGAAANGASNVGAFSGRSVDRGWSDCGHNDYRPGIVLDPFLGSGTTAKVARDHARHAVGIELNETYARLAADRLRQLSLLADGAA